MAAAAIESNWPPEDDNGVLTHYHQHQQGTAAGNGGGEGLMEYYLLRIHDLQLQVRQKTDDLLRLEAQRNDLNSRGFFLSQSRSWAKLRRSGPNKQEN